MRPRNTDRAQLVPALLLALLLVLATSAPAYALPPRPAAFYGTVTQGGFNIPLGTVVSAWIGNVQYASFPVILDNGFTFYFFDVPGDDSETTPGVEGGTAGQTVIFKVGGVTVAQTGAWAEGASVALNLTLPVSAQPPCTVTIRKGLTWTKNRSIQIALNIPGADRMQVSNDGGFLKPRNVAYAPTFYLLLSDVGQRVATQFVYVRGYQAETVLCNGTIFDDIVFDPLPPTLSATLAEAGTASDQQGGLLLRIEASDQEGGSGVPWMQVGTEPSLSGVAWEPFQTERVLPGYAGRAVYVRVRDGAENESAIVMVALPAAGNSLWLPFVER